MSDIRSPADDLKAAAAAVRAGATPDPAAVAALLEQIAGTHALMRATFRGAKPPLAVKALAVADSILNPKETTP
jgi:hypothetical protein